MAEVLDKLIWPQKGLVSSISGAYTAAMWLVGAKAILAEVFRVRVSEVDE
jgi:hypothetical protein